MKTVDPDWPVFELGEEDSAYDLLCEMTPNKDSQGREYEMVTQTLENEDYYQGLNMITVIRRKSDGKLFGYSWWDDISKHGESYMDPNGDEFDLEVDWVAYVFEPVEPYSITLYRHLDNNESGV